MKPRKKQRIDSQVQKPAQNTSNTKDKPREKAPKAVENENDSSEEEVLEDEFDVGEREVPERTAPASAKLIVQMKWQSKRKTIQKTVKTTTLRTSSQRVPLPPQDN